MIKRKFMFELVNEADDEENDNMETTIDNDIAKESEKDDSSDDNSSDDNGGDSDDGGGDDDFNFDGTSSDSDSGDSSSSDSSSSSSLDGGDTEEEPIKANTDIFDSLSSEEQTVKIAELKKMFNELYTSCDDLMHKVSTIDVDDISVNIVSRVNSTLYNLKTYIADYILNIFPIKSYIENDIAFNRFLTVLSSVSRVIESLTEIREKRLKES